MSIVWLRSGGRKFCRRNFWRILDLSNLSMKLCSYGGTPSPPQPHKLLIYKLFSIHFFFKSEIFIFFVMIIDATWILSVSSWILICRKNFVLSVMNFMGSFVSYSNYMAVLFLSPTCQGTHPWLVVTGITLSIILQLTVDPGMVSPL